MGKNKSALSYSKAKKGGRSTSQAKLSVASSSQRPGSTRGVSPKGEKRKTHGNKSTANIMEDPVPSQKRHSYANGIGSKPLGSEKKPPGIEISRLKGSRNSVSKK